MKRRDMSNKYSKSQFIKYAMKTQAYNLFPSLTRGGYRV